ncbi:MAG TPA: transglycosylase SLT domain-containing protein [Actinophytocola sp.]|uniref:WXG100-like domain-containing protein n=1 Tax=Actinophytocola sp. TaxID=1872138 RepID=UPI002DDCAB09|nr:transglycosylase SLT domain-containing protein [Actinophytocola sp.]HEV2781704.1 transglycosylase SLT domain-containing protein [Actinophytocola sp.]
MTTTTRPATQQTPEQSAANLFNDVRSTTDAIERGDWLQAGMGATNVAMDIINLGGDPLGAIGSAGFGFLISQISFLREPFDALLGDANAIMNSAQGWSRASEQLTSTANQYRDAARRETTGWCGRAADAYRRTSETQARNLESMSKVCKGISDGLAGAGKALAEIRKAVLDIINQACKKIIMIMIEAFAAAWGSFGASIAKGIAHSVQTAVSSAQKALQKIQKLVSTLQKVMQLIQKIMQLAQAVKQLLEAIGAKAGGQQRYQPQPVGDPAPLNYGGNISAGTAPSGSPGTVTRQPVDPGAAYTYEGYTPGSTSQLPPGVPSWGPSGPPPGPGYQASRVDRARWIGSAVQILIEHGVDPSRIDAERIAQIVDQGSGGNPHAVNLNHPEAQNGYPPKGLMQLTDPVFQRHHLPAYPNIWMPVDNLVAGIRYRLAQINQDLEGISRQVR